MLKFLFNEPTFIWKICSNEKEVKEFNFKYKAWRKTYQNLY